MTIYDLGKTLIGKWVTIYRKKYPYYISGKLIDVSPGSGFILDTGTVGWWVSGWDSETIQAMEWDK